MPGACCAAQGGAEVEVAAEADAALDAALGAAGQFGRCQRRLLVLATLLGLAAGAGAAEYVFTTARSSARCLIPECEAAGSAEFAPPWLAHAAPAAGCQRYAPRNASAAALSGDACPAALFDPAIVVDCEQYVYADTTTVIHEFELGCAEWRRSLIGSVRVSGYLVALPLAGLLADGRGRRAALLASALASAALGSARSLANSYASFVAAQFLEAALGGGSFTCMYILLQEFMGEKYRVWVGAMSNCSISLGHMTTALLAWLLPGWRHLTLVIYLPQFLFFFYYWLVPESIRWYHSKGKFDKVDKSIKRVARVNGNTLPEKTLLELKSFTEVQKNRSTDKKADEPWLIVDVFRHKPVLMRCLITPFWWITLTFVYYGLSINAVNMVGNRYLNYALVAAVEVPGFCAGAALMARAGRRGALSAGFLLCALCQLAYAALPRDLVGVSLAIYLVGKGSISLVAATVYVYTGELYPTRHRQTLFAFSSMMGRFGAIFAPLTPALGAATAAWLPFALFGALSLAAALLARLTPETRGAPLPRSMCQAARLAHQ